jgi:hypothetical protein
MAGWVGAMQNGLSDEQREAGALGFLGEVLASMDRIA